MSTAASENRADAIFRTGPEDLIQKSSRIVAAPVSNYSRQVHSSTDPGPDGIPLEWTIRAELGWPMMTLKGSAADASVAFERREQSIMLPTPAGMPAWEPDLGHIDPRGRVVVFFFQDGITKVLPGSQNERDFESVVRDIVRIQSVENPTKREEMWIASLRNGSIDDSKKAALRMLLRLSTPWRKIAPGLQALFENPRSSSEMRAFAFGSAAFGVTQGKWPDTRAETVAWLARTFEAEQRARQSLQYLLTLKLLLRYFDEEAERVRRAPLKRLVVDALKRTQARAGLDSQLRQQYEEIRAAYPNEF